jgi:hypothetical protein
VKPLPLWVNDLLSEQRVKRYQVYLRRKGRPPKKTLKLPLPLLCAIDAGKTTGAALLTPAWAVVLEADDEDFLFAELFFIHLSKARKVKAKVCIESGFCPCADAVYRAGVYTGLAFANKLMPALIHPNAKAQIFKQTPLSAKRLLLSHSLQPLNLTLAKTEGEGYFQHAADAVGLAFAYLRHNHNIPTPTIRLF